jgi:hypothetical protein
MAFSNNAAGSRPGQANNTGSDAALFAKLFLTEVLTAYDNASVTEGRFMLKQISHGKSAGFPLTGLATAKYHVPGQSLIETDNGYLSKIGHNEKVINIDDLLTASTFVAQFDELKLHYSVRAPYTDALGKALAKAADIKRLCAAIQAARNTTAEVTGLPVGEVLLKGATVATTASVLAAAIFEAGTVLDEKNIPDSDRVCFLRPRMYDLLAQYSLLIDKNQGDTAVYRDGTVFKINNISLVKTNNLPNTNVVSATTGEQNTYHGDYSNTVALVTHKEAVGEVQLLDMQFESEYQIERQGTLLVAKRANGLAPLRSSAAVEISKGT